jgi:hypothetical protein
LHQGLQELHLLVKVRVDPCVELGVLGLAHGVSLVVIAYAQALSVRVVQQVHEGVDG